MRLSTEHTNENDNIEKLNREYAYVINILPNGAYLNGQKHKNFFENLSFEKSRAVR